MSRRPFFSPPVTPQYGSAPRPQWRRPENDFRQACASVKRRDFAVFNHDLPYLNPHVSNRDIPKRPLPYRNGEVNSYSGINSINRLQQIRKRRSLEEEEKQKKLKLEAEKTFFSDEEFVCFMNPQLIAEFKREVHLHGQASFLVDEVCRFNARYQYNLKTKGITYAEMYSAKNRPIESCRNCCLVCDVYFTDKQIYDIHLKTMLHQRINAIFIKLQEFAKDWFEYKKNIHHTLKESTRIAEKAGVVIKIEDKQPLDEIFKDVDASNFTLENFVLKAYEKQMKSIWPQPKSPYFCRSCNYSEFATNELLERHRKSARHLEFERHYQEAFCISCQLHCGDARGMAKHLRTPQHEQANHLMEVTKIHATNYWHTHKDDVKKSDKNQLEKDKKPKMLCEQHTERISPNKQNKAITSPFKQDTIIEEPCKETTHQVFGHQQTSTAGKECVNDMIDVVSGDTAEEIRRYENNAKEISNKNDFSTISISETELNTCEFKERLKRQVEAKVTETMVQEDEVKQTENYSEPVLSLITQNEVNTVTMKTDVHKCTENTETSTEQLPNANNFSKSQITQLLEIKQRNRDLEHELENFKNKLLDLEKSEIGVHQKEDESPTSIVDDSDDKFIVPLTGFMCTVCHETIEDKQQVLSHKMLKTHQQNVQDHRIKFAGLFS
ncbi:uncharacterized protein LOC130641529 [Hydractinia symbiolongicarpus]|uniref:uncharacterized protein LOC130641529 n=1 Tax=Hydractinia symbiolongicarpus TaxID=13093 RepID=UPI00254F3252|nr:uncharacterized protein LOC130641529 [Hydractinia symbiolongicarpus]